MNLSTTDRRANTTRVLLVGFLNPELERISFLLRQMGWQIQIRDGGEETCFRLPECAFDVVVIDADNSAVFAPKLVEQVRARVSLSRKATVLVVETTGNEGLRNQLTHAGADLISSLSNEPMYFLPELMNAAIRRFDAIRDKLPTPGSAAS